MKKIIYSVLLILVMLFATFCIAGCGDDEENNSSEQSSLSQNTDNAQTGEQNTDGTQNIDGSITPGVTTSANVSSQDPSNFVANKDAEKAVGTILGYIKKGKFEKAQKLILPKQQFDPEPDLGFDEPTMEKIKKIFAKLEYTVINSNTQSETTAIVNVKIKAADFQKIFTEYVKNVEEALSKGYNSNKEHDKLINEAFQKSLKDNGTKLVENQITINLVKEKDTWKIQDDINFSKAVLGGIFAVSNIFNDM
ncbi:MAG: hypothetical protein E7542_06370 [Ruminococcaceae bacterium]|nr:hypothetical protein [Oscillospiraceae bacterium]